MQCHQHTIETIVAQHENGQDVQGPQELAERNMVPDQGNVQTTTLEKHRAHVSHTVRTDIQVYIITPPVVFGMAQSVYLYQQLYTIFS